ncbi:hypothetical protein JW926_07270, partial [Candidatus Sumerlaeota bacterium]|nr:hypothetical protein [Candidatus Sumerlaeota bacterium]
MKTMRIITKFIVLAAIAVKTLNFSVSSGEEVQMSLQTPIAAFERLSNWGCSPGGKISLDYHGQHTGQSCVTWRVPIDKTPNIPSCAWVANLDIPHDATISFRLRCDVKYLLIGMEDEKGQVGLCPTLPDVAPQTWGEVRLKPAELPVMGDPKAKLGRVNAMVFITHGGAGELTTPGIYSYSFDCMRLVTEADPSIDNPKETLPQRPAFDEIELLPKEEFTARFENVKKKLEDVEALLKTLKSEGKRSDYETASAAVVRCLLNAPMEDFQTNWFPHRATKMLLFFEECLDRTGQRIEEIRSGARKPPEIPSPSLAKLTVRNGMFFSGDQPVLLTGLMGWGLDIRLSLFSELGFNFISMETGLAPNLPEEGVLKKDENTLNHIRAAQENNFAIDILVSPHYRPGWIDKKYPGVDIRGQRRARGHFTNWNV